ncbi:hypothetical protein [Streptococcus pneumoniae]|uniref:hypothetical protein n=1 Tax=Streptococcus pneumoniae TaxID=1313 RepID=UPI001C5EF09D|nr:hypothetical protein [Streptococcus pneumoniae]
MEIKEQARKLAAGYSKHRFEDCSKHCFEVVSKTDEVSSKHCFEVVDKLTKSVTIVVIRLTKSVTIPNPR